MLMLYDASYQLVIKAVTKSLQKCRHAYIIRVVSQLTYPKFLRKVFVSVYLPRSLVQVLRHHKNPAIMKYDTSLFAILEDLYE